MKKWLIAAALLVIFGSAILTFAAYSVGWDLSKLGTGNYETNTHQVNEEFGKISIKTDTADIFLAASDDEKCTVVCYEKEKLKHSVTVDDGTLTVNVIDTRKWYDYIDIGFASPKVTVFLPKSEYSSLFIDETTGDVEISGDLGFESVEISLSTGDVECYARATGAVKIATSTGNVSVENTSVGSLAVSLSTGDVHISHLECGGDVSLELSTGQVYLDEISCKNLVSDASTGDVSLDSVIAAEKITIERSTGDVSFRGADAAELFVKTTTGDVEGYLLSEKVFIVRTDTGDIDVPRTQSGGRCEISTETGDVEITIGE